jgi:hypothetical protein
MRGRSRCFYWLLPTNSTRIVGFRGDDIRAHDVSHACRAVSGQRPHCDRRTCERRFRSRQMGGPGADLAGAPPTITGRALTAHLPRSVAAALAALGPGDSGSSYGWYGRPIRRGGAVSVCGADEFLYAPAGLVFQPVTDGHCGGRTRCLRAACLPILASRCCCAAS